MPERTEKLVANDWIDPRLFADDAISLAEGPAHAPRLFIVDNFLTQPALDNLVPLFRDHRNWRDSYGVFRARDSGQPSRVSRDEWLAAPSKARFWFYRELRENIPGGALSAAQACGVLLRVRVFADPVLVRWLAARTSLELSSAAVEATALSVGRGHFQMPHGDNLPHRALCGALYLSDGWKEGFGGEFEMTIGNDVVYSVPPRANRLVLFDPHEKPAAGPGIQAMHRLRPLTAAAGDWKRWSISIWWTKPERKS